MSYKENLEWTKPTLGTWAKPECEGILRQSLSVRCAKMTSPQKGETAVYGYDPLCFWFFRCRIDVLQS